MFSKRRISPHVYNKIESGSLDLHYSNFYVPTPVDEFSMQPVLNDDGSESVTLTSDICMLFNQERLDKCSRESLLKYFDSLSVTSSPLSTLRSNLSDDQLISLVKSRYIQTPSELMAYSSSIVSEYGIEIAKLAAVSTDPNPVDSPQPSGKDPSNS